MEQYYYMTGPRSKNFSTARIDPKVDQYNLYDLVDKLKSPNDWQPINFIFSSGIICDFPASDFLGKICSNRLKEILQPYSGDGAWLPVIMQKYDKSFVYFFLHYFEIPDVLDFDKSEFRANRLFIPHISIKKARGLHVFCLSKHSNALIVSEKIRKLMREMKIGGLNFEKIKAT